MKKYYYVLMSFFILCLLFQTYKVEAKLPLIDKVLVIDPGHGR